jgi:short-subunit dehydrogenase
MPPEPRRIAITGGSGDLGRRITQRLAAPGVEIVVLDRNPPTSLGVRHIACDLATHEGVDAAAEALAAAGCDVLINLAGVQYCGPVEGEGSEQVARTFQVNLLAPIRLTQAALPRMRAKGAGHIVNIGSILGAINFAHFATYSSSKAGLRGFSEALRRELAGSGVAVTHISPRGVRTAFNSPRVEALARATNMTMDDPDRTAERIVRAVVARRREVDIGFPEAIFVRLNALFPSLVDRALAAGDRRAARLFAGG